MRGLLFSAFVATVAGHGSMLNPVPRSAHQQAWDSRNKCGSSDPYSTAGMNHGEYCGLGCLGDACLYYQIGCFHGCASCSLQGKTLYPVPSDLKLAGCNESSMPEPSLGGGNATLEHMLRTYNIDNDSQNGDWTKWLPWRSPGHAGRGNPDFQPCGINSGALSSQPEPPTTAKDVPNGGPGTSLPSLPRDKWTVWKAGSVVEAEWAIYANHAGGYSYRLCKKEKGKVATEACYQKMPLEFATPETEIRYKDDSQKPFKVQSLTTDVGTYPPGSQWRKNPVPMCNCDIGLGCGGKTKTNTNEKAKEAALAHFKVTMSRRLGGGKSCQADPTCKPEAYACKVCEDDPSAPDWSCKTCCPNCEEEHKDGGMYCACKNGPSPAPNPMFNTYKHTHFRPGQTNKLCPTGVQYPTLWDGGAGAGYKGNSGNIPPGGHGGEGFGNFDFTMVDKLKVPNVSPGEYSVSWRWDCEETPQVWNSCADIIITA